MYLNHYKTNSFFNSELLWQFEVFTSSLIISSLNLKKSPSRKSMLHQTFAVLSCIFSPPNSPSMCFLQTPSLQNHATLYAGIRVNYYFKILLYLGPRCWCPVVLVLYKCQTLPPKKHQSLLKGVSVELINTGISCNALWHTSLTAALAAKAETLWKTVSVAFCALSVISKSEFCKEQRGKQRQTRVTVSQSMGVAEVVLSHHTEWAATSSGRSWERV